MRRVAHNESKAGDGFGDFQALVKYGRAASDEEGGNYILTAFLAVSAPTGQFNNGALNPIITATIAYGKGSGISTCASLPTGNTMIGQTYS
jgi:hypothetical protein